METLKVRVSYRSLYRMLTKNYYCNTQKNSATNAIFNNVIIPFHGNQGVLWLFGFCLNQCECISGRKPSASLRTAASFVCFCGQIQEFDAAPCYLGNICLCVCVFLKIYSFPHHLSFTDSWKRLSVVHVCVCEEGVVGITRNKGNERQRN